MNLAPASILSPVFLEPLRLEFHELAPQQRDKTVEIVPELFHKIIGTVVGVTLAHEAPVQFIVRKSPVPFFVKKCLDVFLKLFNVRGVKDHVVEHLPEHLP